MLVDPLVLDAEALRSLASDPVVRRGIAYFREHRVTDLWSEGRRVRALVQGTRRDMPYVVEVEADEDDELAVRCDCPFDLEPACKHAVATLLAYGAQHAPDGAAIGSAADEAVEARAHRGRTEVVVRHLAGDPWFGTFGARSLRGSGTEWRVQVRSLADRANHCTCPDFSVNLLGTCKHIEAVLHRLRQDDAARYARLEVEGPPVSALVLAWEVPEAPRIRWIGPPGTRALAEAFDADGLLRGDLPDAWHAIESTVSAAGVQVGDDVRTHLRAVAEAHAHAHRAHAIADTVRASGGRLPGVRARLYPYQVDGVAFLAATGRALLADDMGLGKTLQTLAAAMWLVQHGQVERVLIVSPASLKHQWAREIERFTGARAEVVGGSPMARRAAIRRRARFTIVNYELLLRDVDLVQRDLAPDLMVLDEAQRIKNWRTKTAAAVKSLDTRYAFVLTGTPLENRLEDLYSLMQVVDPRVFGPLWRFLVEFHVTDERGKVLGYRNLGELRRRLSSVMLRRDRSFVRDQLPDRIELRLDVELDGRQRSLHDEALASAASLAARAEHRPLTPAEEHQLMAALQRAQMACDAAGLVDGEAKGSPKLDELERLLDEVCVEGGRKVVVFSQWERMTALAEAVVARLGLGWVRLHGGVPTAARGALVDQFRDDPATQVFLSTDAGATGLNLQVATTLVHLDLPWNPALLDQRSARIHRLGQREPVQVVMIVAADSYESHVAGLIASKRELFRNAVEPGADQEVVGLTKRSLEAALDSLVGLDGRATPPPRDEPAPLAAEPAEPTSTPASTDDPSSPAEEADDPVSPVVAALERILGTRIERIVGAAGGIVVVVDALDPLTASVASTPHPVPVAVVDALTFAALQRVGAAPTGPTLAERVAAAPRASERRLGSAEALLAAGRPTDAVELAVRAMLDALAERGETATPPRDRAAAWVFGELLPSGAVTGDEAATVGRALALATGADVPTLLAEAILGDAARVVGA